MSIKVADNIILRKEFFGGLIFRKKDLAIFEINDKTFELLNLVKELRNLDDVFEHFRSKYQLNRGTFMSITELLLDQHIIVNE